MVNSFVFPFSIFVKNVHFLGSLISINHIKVKDGILLHPAQPGGGPVIVFCDRDDLVDWQVNLLDSVELKGVEAKEFALWEKFHS